MKEFLLDNYPQFFSSMSNSEIEGFIGMMVTVCWVATVIVALLLGMNLFFYLQIKCHQKILFAALSIYLWAVVYSFHKELQEEVTGGGGDFGFTQVETGKVPY